MRRQLPHGIKQNAPWSLKEKLNVLAFVDHSSKRKHINIASEHGLPRRELAATLYRLHSDPMAEEIVLGHWPKSLSAWKVLDTLSF